MLLLLESRIVYRIGSISDRWCTNRMIQILLLLQHVLLLNQIQILHETLALMVFGLVCHMDDLSCGSFKLLSTATYLLHMFSLLLILHYLPLLSLLTLDLILLMLRYEILILLRKILILKIQIHTLQSLMIHLIDLLVYILRLIQVKLLLGVSIWYTLDA